MFSKHVGTSPSKIMFMVVVMLKDVFTRKKEIGNYWFNKSSDLMGSAGALWTSRNKERSDSIVQELGLGEGYSMDAAVNPVYRMLCGMSLELMYKAVIVAKGHEVKTSHKLVELARLAGVVVSEFDKGLLEIITESVIWDGRYPVPKDKKSMDNLNSLTTDYLYDKKPFGTTHILSPNNSLNWDSFYKLWSDGCEVYWANYSPI